jgi:hypothetical protein
VLAAYYVVQKPIGPIPLQGLMLTLWTLVLTALVLIAAAGIGEVLIDWFKPREITPSERILFGICLGLGALGFFGLGLSVMGWVQPLVFGGILLVVLIIFGLNGKLGQAREDWIVFWTEISGSFSSIHFFLKLAIGLIFLITLIQALAPPYAFDALSYHLEFPARILRDGGIRPYDVMQFWFPGMPEGTYLWVMALGSDRAPQLIHLSWMLIAVGLIWKWAQIWSDRAAWLAVAIIISIPSLPLVASWAYTDFALSCATIACLYALYRFALLQNSNWLNLSGVFAGLAMGVKYTSFLLPVTTVLMIIWWGRKNLRIALVNVLKFSLIALVVAAPWYLRNWYYMGNPIYPFIFGGRYWNPLRAALNSMKGTGLGWDVKELLLLPLTATLGYRDSNFYDGRIGPLFLILAPVVLFTFWKARYETDPHKKSLAIIGFYSIISFSFWTIGVINTQSLWQVRLLYPALMLLVIPMSLGIIMLAKLDAQRLKTSSMFTIILGIVIGITILDSILFFSSRNPLSVVLGTESEKNYLSRVIPEYSKMLDLLDKTPPDSRIYELFEPRSYRAARLLQSDPFLDQLARDINLYGDAQGVVNAWRAQGYSHILLYRWGVDFLNNSQPSVLTPQRKAELDLLTQNYLKFVSRTPDGYYELYAIPPAP